MTYSAQFASKRRLTNLPKWLINVVSEPVSQIVASPLSSACAKFLSGSSVKYFFDIKYNKRDINRKGCSRESNFGRSAKLVSDLQG